MTLPVLLLATCRDGYVCKEDDHDDVLSCYRASVMIRAVSDTVHVDVPVVPGYDKAHDAGDSDSAVGSGGASYVDMSLHAPQHLQL